MKYLFKSLSVLTFTIPVDILIAGCIIQGISFADAGAFLCGMLILFIGGLYIWFGASPKNRIPLGCIVAGLVISICSFIALIIGLCLVASPLAFIGGGYLWQKSKIK